MKKLSYKHTMAASIMGYLALAITNAYVPLLYVTFKDTYGISLEKIGILATVNFTCQVVADLFAPKIIGKFGYKKCVVASLFIECFGVLCLTIFPDVFPTPLSGLLTAGGIYAIGAGTMEVLVNGIVEACPNESKSGAISFLHSGYCWGCIILVSISTAFFAFFGTENWKIITALWTIIPFVNAIYFTRVPVRSLEEIGEATVSPKKLISMKSFWIMAVLVLLAGASEQAISQWVSAFAEEALGVSKTTGDLAGVLMFALMMGISRTVYATFSKKIDLYKYMMFSLCLCIVSYLVITLSPWPVVSLIGCAVCGFSVGILWPGSLSLSAGEIKGGIALFSFLALAGDLGCSIGPSTVTAASSVLGGNLNMGMLCAIVFPITTLIILAVRKKSGKLSQV